MEDREDWLTLPAIASKMGVSESWLDKHWKELKLPLRRVGKRLLRALPADLDAWLEKQPLAFE